MDELDRLGWADGRVYRGFGLRIGVRASDRRVLAGLGDRPIAGLQPSRATSPFVDRLYCVVRGASEGRLRGYTLAYANAARIARSMDEAAVLAIVRSDLERAVAELARTRVFVHAGVVGWRGGAIVIPGVTQSGKTSLVQALVQAGAVYYSDEYAVLDDRGRVHPFARPLGARGGDGRVVGAATPPRVGRTPLPISHVIATRFVADGQWRPRRLTRAGTLMALLRNTVAVRNIPDRALNALAASIGEASGHQGVRGDAAVAARALLAA
jgi:hypothetical protein